MSKVGNKSYTTGQYSIYCSDLTLSELQALSNNKLTGFPKNSLIISSPQNSLKEDAGTPAVMFTDGEGDILPLTYSLSKDFTIVNNTAYITGLSYYTNALNNYNETISYYENIISKYDEQISGLSNSVNRLTKIIENICNEQNWDINELSEGI